MRYDAEDTFELPTLTELVGRADRGEGARVDDSALLAEGAAGHQLDATYFDTADLRLTAAGLTLRRRTGGDDAGWHLTASAGGGGRSEVRLPLGRGARTVPAAMRQLVWACSRGAALVPVAKIVTDRTVCSLVDATGQVLAEVADDRVTARRLLPLDGAGDAVGGPTSWREIEVELADGNGDLLEAVDSRLRERGLRRADPASGLVRMLGLDGRGRGTSDQPRKLTAKAPAGYVVLVHVRGQVEQIQAQDLPVRLDAPDAVHKMRVATRRLRSALATFKPLFDDDVVGPLRAELKWLAGELGAARDAEVMRDRVRRAVEGENEFAGLGPVAEVAAAELGQGYRDAHDRVLAELDGERYHRLLVAIDELVVSPPFTEQATVAAGKALPRLVARSYAKVRRLVEGADAKPAGDEREELLHDARKAAKQTRYAGESVSGVFGKEAIAFAEAMEGVQEALGEHQDSVLTRERLRELALHTSSTAAAFLYGRLHALEEARAQQSQQHFDAAWKAAGRKPLHRWLR
jgi:CHAD domain-containing protein